MDPRFSLDFDLGVAMALAAAAVALGVGLLLHGLVPSALRRLERAQTSHELPVIWRGQF